MKIKKSFFLPQGYTHTPPAQPTALPSIGLALQWQMQDTGYRCTTEYASFATLTVLMSTARDGFPHQRPAPKSKGSFQSFPLYPYITHWICMMVVTFVNQCNPNKNINFVCRQSHFKIISATVFTVVLQQFYNKNWHSYYYKLSPQHVRHCVL